MFLFCAEWPLMLQSNCMSKVNWYQCILENGNKRTLDDCFLFSGRSFDGVILEGAFNTKGQEMPTFTWVNSWNLSLLTCGLCISSSCFFITLNLLMYYFLSVLSITGGFQALDTYSQIQGKKTWLYFLLKKSKFPFNACFKTTVNQLLILLLQLKNAMTIWTCYLAVWRKWHARSFSSIQRTITWFPFRLFRRYYRHRKL